MSSLNAKQGFWYEWGTRTWSITLDDEHAFILVGAWMILANIVGYALWEIFGHLYSYYYTRHPKQPNWLTPQVVTTMFRSNKSAWGVVFWLLWKNYKYRGRLCLKYTWYFLLFAAVILGPGVLALSIAAPWWLTYGTQETPTVRALPQSGTGGLWLPNSFTDSAAIWREGNFNANTTQAADVYFSSCYEKFFSTRCVSQFVTTSLPYTIAHNTGPCPFRNVCATDPGNDLFNPYRIETPWLKMHDLGINTNTDIQMRIGTTCAPVSAKLFCKNCDTDDPYFDYTFGDELHYAYRFHFNSTTALGYRLYSALQDVTGKAKMDERLTSSDGVTSIMIFNDIGINYLEPNQDPIFYADRPIQYDIAPNTTFYHAKRLISMLGCITQVQISNNHTGALTRWVAPEALYDDPKVFDTLATKKIGLILRWAVGRLNIHSIIAGRGAAALRVFRTLSGMTQTQMAPNQSMVEAMAWFGVGLAKLQLLVLNLGTGDPNFNATGFVNLLAQDISKEYSDLGGMILYTDGNYSRLSALGIFSIGIIALLCLLALLLCRCLKISGQHHVLSLDHSPSLHGIPLNNYSPNKPSSYLATPNEHVHQPFHTQPTYFPQQPYQAQQSFDAQQMPEWQQPLQTQQPHDTHPTSPWPLNHEPDYEYIQQAYNDQLHYASVSPQTPITTTPYHNSRYERLESV